MNQIFEFYNYFFTAGVIDVDNGGEIKVVFKHSDKDYFIEAGDRIFQIICQTIPYTQLEK